MKKILLFAIVALICLVGRQEASAQEGIDWTEHHSTIENLVTEDKENGTFFYLYNVEQKQFLGVGETYGVMGILTYAGSPFSLVKSKTKENAYLFHSRQYTNNEAAKLADCLGFFSYSSYNSRDVIYLDRGNFDGNGNDQNDEGYFNYRWELTWEDGAGYLMKTVDKNHLYASNTNGDYYLTCDEISVWDESSQTNVTKQVLKGVEESEKANHWLFISVKDFRDLTSDYSNDKEIDISSLILDASFTRNNKDEVAWKWTNETTTQEGFHAIGDKDENVNDDNFIRDKAQYYAAEIKNEKNELIQTIEGLAPGVYKVTCEGFHIEATDAYLIANGVKTPIKSLEDEMITNEKGNENIGAGEVISNNPGKYLTEVTVVVGTNGKLEFGFGNGNTDGRVFADNFHLYFCKNDYHLYFSENNSTDDNVDNRDYTDPVMMYFRRYLTLNTWNALTLPVNLTAGQVKQAFGQDAKLSKLTGVQVGDGIKERPYVINFNPIKLDEDNNTALEANECYVIYPTKGPDVAPGVETSYNKKTDEENGYTQVTVKGPIYLISNVTQKNYNVEKIEKSDYTVSDKNGTLTFIAYYTRQDKAEKGSYVVESGTMYHLTSEWGPLYASRWQLKYEKNGVTTANALGFRINGIMDTPTSIGSIVCGAEANNTASKVFNLNGQNVGEGNESLGNLPKGVYIMNGKKFVIK